MVAEEKFIALESLLASGLDSKDIKKLKIQFLDETKTKELTGKYLQPSYLIPYFDITGEVIPSFFRLRFIGAHDPKYTQPAGAIPRLYLPPLIDWKHVATDARQEIYITEGEKKAAKATKEGLPCIGLGGVWNFKSKKAALPLIEDFRQFNWLQRRVNIVFDSDVASKAGVLGAMHTLSRELTKLGAHTAYVQLPELDTEKTGLDDFLVAHGVEAFRALPVTEFETTRDLWSINKEYAVIEYPGLILDVVRAQHYNLNTFVNVVLSHRRTNTYDSNGKPVEKGLAKMWTEWPCRRQHTKIDYVPGKPEVLANNTYNSWRGWGVKPIEGKTPGPPPHWKKLLNHIFRGNKDNIDWFEKWCAYPLQYPGAKLYTGVILWGSQGTGKSLIGHTLGRIYGENFSEVQRQDITGAYNDWCVNKQFVLVEEATGTDKRDDGDRLKHIISRSKIHVSIKYIPAYDVTDCVNYYFTSNHCDALFLEGGDRRFFVIEVPETPLPNDFFARYDTWYRSDLVGQLFYYLLNVDLKGFNPKAPALITQHKREMIELSASDLDLWCQDLKRSPEKILQLTYNRDIYTPAELVKLYEWQQDKKCTIIALTKALRRAGFPPPQLVSLVGEGSRRVVAVKNVKYWKDRDARQWGIHYAETCSSVKDSTHTNH